MSDTVPGAPIWIELFTHDTDASIAFYGGLFGWSADESGPEYGGYIMFRLGEGPVAGCMRNDAADVPDAWSVYLESNDAAATAAMVKANGGQVYVEPMQVGEMGHMAFAADPGGAAVGIWQPLEHRGFGSLREPSAPAWFELHTSVYDDAVAFYENVFGWVTHTMSDTADFRYTTLGRDDTALAGIMDDTAAGVSGPSSWSFYIAVAETDAAAALATELGGSVDLAPQDTPYGRMARLTDPSGVSFMVMGPNTLG